MKIERLLVASVVALLLVVVGIAWVMPVQEGVGGYPHAERPSMSSGGSGMARHGGILIVGWAFGMLTILHFVLLVAFGARRGDELRGLGRPLIIAFVAYAAVFSWILLAYRAYLVDPGGPMILGLPLPSAVMLYLLYPVSAIFNVYYATGFRRWVLTAQDEARYRQIVDEHRRRAAAGDPD